MSGSYAALRRRRLMSPASLGAKLVLILTGVGLIGAAAIAGEAALRYNLEV